MRLTKEQHVERLLQWMVGSWSNRTQIINHPHKYAHVIVEIKLCADGRLHLTQRKKSEDKPYRERLLELRPGKRVGEIIIITYQPGEPLTKKNDKSNEYVVKWNSKKNMYEGSVNPEQGLKGTYRGKEYVLSSRLVVSEDALLTQDRGIEPGTNSPLWGQNSLFFFERLNQG
jgi:hypothetical protein